MDRRVTSGYLHRTGLVRPVPVVRDKVRPNGATGAVSFVRKQQLAIAAMAVGLPLLCATHAQAQVTWNGNGGDNLWNDGGNWVGGTPPIPGASALSFDGVTQLTNQNNFTNATFKGIGFTAAAGAFDLTGNAIHLGEQTTGTGITAAGDIVSAAVNDETVGIGLTLDAGRHNITTGTNALNLSGAITQSVGSTAVFTTGGGNINLAGAGLANSNGILGGWATIGGNWATLDPSNNVVAYAGYTDVPGGGTIGSDPTTNVRIPVNGAAIAITAPTTQINTLLFGGGAASAAAQTVGIGAGNTLVLGQNGGIFNTTSAGGTVRNLVIGASVATGGTVTAGDGVNPANITLSSTFSTAAQSIAGAVTVNSAIANNVSAPVSVTVSGGYVTLAGANTFSGGTYILSGRVSQPTASSFGTGPVFIFAGGQTNPGVPLTNNFTIAGNGTAENNGMGALRMFGTANLSGMITLMDNASVSSNGSTTGTIGISGQITGPGGLGIGSPTTTNAGGTGTVFIGATTGAAVANNYAGDTTINGAAGGVVSAGLKIGAASDNNIMPHGLTGSFAGGPTGNVVLNANTRTATFDLNGSTQTINGLSTTPAGGANNIVTSSVAGAQLILGDSNATASFGGNIQDGGAGLTLALTKIGAGNQALSGIDAYTGGTTVSTGTLTLASATALPSASNVIDNAALAVNANTTAGNVNGTGSTSVASGVNFTTNSFSQTGGLSNAGAAQINGSGTTGVITGAGTLTLGTVAGPNANTLTLAFGSGQSTQSALTVNTGSTLDLTNNSLDLHYGASASPDSTVRGYVRSGYNGGNWQGTGVTSSTAAADIVHHAVGYADGGDNIVPGLASGDELIKYTFAGDANLDGKVDVSDLGILATNYGHLTGQRWDQGDFTYDSGVDVSDLGVLATNYGAGTGVTGAAAAAMFQSDLKVVEAEDPAFAAAIGAVPEPASIGLLAVGSLTLLGRRRRKGC